jgi:hypothetical protein
MGFQSEPGFPFSWSLSLFDADEIVVQWVQCFHPPGLMVLLPVLDLRNFLSQDSTVPLEALTSPYSLVGKGAPPGSCDLL